MGKQQQEIYDHMMANKDELARRWIDSSAGDGQSYAFNIEDEEKLRRQHNALIEAVSSLFIENERAFKLHINGWAESVASDWVKNGISIEETIAQFRIIRAAYWNFVKDFILSEKEDFTIEDAFYWSNLVNDAFAYISENFARHYEEAHKHILASQQKMITELSSPVIPVKRGIGILPIVGDIDTYRAKVILETTLDQASRQKLDQLFIDLSAVPIVDTMVAHQLFQLIDALRLIGVDTVLSGIRPEIAQTAVQLGIDFKETRTQSTLMDALEIYS
ncbi:STAS domain-containing protein [Bhargavaea ullalensis]|uniref:RsbT co-antagonist protein RsbR n=1 Tax=Bhargavaea ullalensis TaxID=1265685 RepID=A0ABV2G8T8_9BACL